MKEISLFDRVQAKFINPYIDNKIWLLSDESEKVKSIFWKFHSVQIPCYYPELDLKQLEKNHPEQFEFLSHKFTSYIYEITNAVLEPEHGWVILKPFSIFRYSFPLVNDPWDKNKRRPSTIRFFNKKKKTVILKEAISIRYAWQNYYHFFIDTLSQLYLLEEKGIPDHIPVIIPYFFHDADYTQEFLELSSFVKRKLILQKRDEYFHVDQLIVCKDTFFSDSVYRVVDSLKKYRVIGGKSKLFVFRPMKHGRAILNIEEIKMLVSKFGFTVLDSSGLSLQEQIKIFSGASEIIGIHGAGLANIIFRINNPLKLMEIFPGKDLTPEHYKNLSLKLGYDYTSIEGNGRLDNDNFVLSESLLKSSISSFF